MTLFIAVTGTHSTGKSTFLDKVADILTAQGVSVGRVEDKASDCRDRGFPILRDHTFESTLWIMSSVIRGELEAALSASVVLVDRPVSDAIAYLEAALQVTDRALPDGDRAYLYALARLHSSRYDMVFRTVLDRSVPLGPGRDPDLAFRTLVDKRMSSVLEEVEIHAPALPVAADVAQQILSRVSDG